ncbi:carbamoyltransferase [Paraglaciecola aquimarina]|uniref:Carbamoyltransferase n=1 Tax=Paraglaciecola algarum TaxID=3050085 RepID=A0ABS9D6Q4_9ALTE|nr:carbamoyltransferase [Paraglaciecola sp. G1-23]MCF2948107.1 carbamoyltransferase [Paraglaciecola sp. G1-23]
MNCSSYKFSILKVKERLMYTLGISAYYHDSAAALLKDDKIIAAAQEERFTRIKHDAAFPIKAVNYCLEEAEISLSQIDSIVYYENPTLKLSRIISNHIKNVFKGFFLYMDTFPQYLLQKHFIKRNVTKILGKEAAAKLTFLHHHTSHLASAFYPSPFEDAAIITMDGVGEIETTTIAHGEGSNIQIKKTLEFPDSVGLLYSVFTVFCGFKVNSGEYKLMGLAPYGQPKYKDLIQDKLVKIFADGSIKLNMEYFNFCHEPRMFGEKLEKLIGIPARTSESPLTQEYADIASSIQDVTEIIVLKIAQYAKTMTNSKNLCLAGGVALNCVANGRLLKESGFDKIWIQPASGDAGTALGAALHHVYSCKPRTVERENTDSMQGSYLGPQFSDENIEKALIKLDLSFTKLKPDTLIEQTASLLKNDKVIGWFQGRMEFGPRALGNRSIIGNAQSPNLQKQMNLKIKFRESFRPFAPSVLEEDVEHYFQLQCPSPYMLLVATVNQDRCLNDGISPNIESDIHQVRSDIPAVTHVDYTARVQSVSKKTNPKYHALISKFKSITDSAVIINTSFNIRGEPIVCTPEDAIKCFKLTHMDALAIGNYLVLKEQNPSNKEEIDEYINSFEKD